MASVIQSNFRIRKNLGSISRVIEIPNLIDIQKSSYDKFLQTNVPSNDRTEVGLQAVFRSVFPIKDFNGTSELVFVSYNLEKPKYDVDECRQRGMTFAIVALAAPYQNVQTARLMPDDNCYWYEHAGQVETTLLPLNTAAGRQICVQRQ